MVVISLPALQAQCVRTLIKHRWMEKVIRQRHPDADSWKLDRIISMVKTKGFECGADSSCYGNSVQKNCISFHFNHLVSVRIWSSLKKSRFLLFFGIDYNLNIIFSTLFLVFENQAQYTKISIAMLHSNHIYNFIIVRAAICQYISVVDTLFLIFENQAQNTKIFIATLPSKHT